MSSQWLNCWSQRPSASRLVRGKAICVAIACVLVHATWVVGQEHNWPQWRGPLGTGEAPNANPPLNWDAVKNVAWKTKLPGRGHSTPIVWEEQIFLTSAIPVGEELPARFSGRPGAHDNLPVDSEYEFVVLAIDRESGAIQWQTKVRRALPKEGGHKSASLASASVVTDGELVIALFGSHGLYALNRDGNVVWNQDLGQMHSKHGHGEGASPVLSGNTVVVNWDHEGQSFIVALDKFTGRELWRRLRDEVTSWSTPLIVETDRGTHVIVCGTQRVRAYDLSSGSQVWECGGMSANIVATPVYASGMLFVGSSYEKRAMLAIRLNGASGDITDSDQVVWTRTRGTPYVPSPLLTDGGLYFLAHYQNILTRVDAETGREAPGPMRLGALSSIYASPVASADHIFVTDLSGNTMVIQAGDAPRVIAVNPIGENVNASLAISGPDLFIRGEHHLVRVTRP